MSEVTCHSLSPLALARDYENRLESSEYSTKKGAVTMTSINWTRVLLGGLVAGVIIDVSEGLLNGVFLAADWANAMKALNKPEISGSSIAAFNVMGLAIGIFTVWLYAAMRPRFGPGPKTALGAGLATWVIGYVLPSVAPWVLHLYSR